MSTVVAVFEMTWLSRLVSRNSAASMARGPPAPSGPRPATMSCMPPVFSSAVAMGRMAAIRTTLSQLMER
jgi:hypothetical protein